MTAPFRLVFACTVFGLALAGCSMLGPDPSIHVTGDSTLTWSDVREIERFLPSLGIKYPITEIATKGPDRADIICTIRPSYEGNPTEEVESFTVIRRGGHWVVVGRPRKERRYITS